MSMILFIDYAFYKDKQICLLLEKLSQKLSDIGENIKTMMNTPKAFDEDAKLFDNQDWAFFESILPNISTLPNG
ncbi:MAG: hypothetical protein GX963_06710 [Bacteroidales bacterium]|nr:hypothetical protein [Bacteroidales bacterium]